MDHLLRSLPKGIDSRLAQRSHSPRQPRPQISIRIVPDSKGRETLMHHPARNGRTAISLECEFGRIYAATIVAVPEISFWEVSEARCG